MKRVIMLKDYFHDGSRARFHRGQFYALPLSIVRDLLEAEVAYWEDREPKDLKILKRIYQAAEKTEESIKRGVPRRRRKVVKHG